MESESYRYRKQKRYERETLEALCKIALNGTDSNAFLSLLDSIENYEVRKQLTSKEQYKGQDYLIFYVLRGDNIEILKTLLRYGDIKQILTLKSPLEQNTPLHIAASKGNWDMIEVLMQHGFNVLTRNQVGYTPLDMCKQHGFFHLVEKMENYNGFMYCRLGCHQSMPLKDLKTHETVLCRFAIVACPYCQKLMTVGDLRDQHDCQKELVKCKLCNDWFEAQDLIEHDKTCCMTTTRECPKGCGLQVPVKMLVDHKLNHCEEREIQCERCAATMKAKELGRHLLYSCVERNGECNMCGLVLPIADLQPHKDNLCPKRKVQCRFGCTVLAEERAHHEMNHLRKEFREWTIAEFLWWLDLTYFANNFHGFVHKTRIHQLIMEKNINGKHLVKLWGKRFVELFGKILSKTELSQLMKHLMRIKCSCPRECGEILYLGDLADHKDFCRKRTVRCLKCGVSVVAENLLIHRSTCSAASRRNQGLRKRGPSARLPSLNSKKGIAILEKKDGSKPTAVLVKDEVEQAISVHVERAKEEHRLKTQVLTIHV